MDTLGDLGDALKYIDEMKLVAKAAPSATGKSVYGQLKREMYRETVGYLERWGEEDARDFAIAEKARREREASVKRVEAWQKAKL